jgi:tricorn protease
MNWNSSVGRLLACAGLATLGLSAAALHADVVPEAGMLRYPDVSKSQIAFVYAGDIWLVGREGGQATLLASPPGQELFPKFSPDGKHLAFMGNYEGNRDIYTIPVTGGTATRVTHHPSTEMLCDWTQDNRLLFYMSGLGGLRRQTQLFTVDPTGGLPQQLPVPYGANGSISADSQWLAYTPHSTDFRTWKRYRGGMATDIWLFNLKDHTSRKATDFEGTDTIPMWNGNKLYYLSDDGPEHRLNIWVFNPETDHRKQVTKFKDFDVKWPSMGPGPSGKGEIVFQCGASLYLLDLNADELRPKPVKVTIPGDRPQVRARQVDAAGFITGWSISPSAKRVAVSARGDIWSLPAEKGSPRNLHRTSAAAQRDPSWSPDGRWIAYFCDTSGEYELCITQSDGLGETIQLTKEGDASHTFRYNPIWSPDSRKIAFTDKTGALYIHTLGEASSEGVPTPGTTRHIDTDPWAGRLNVGWSHDSQWVTYSRTDADARQGVIWVCNVDEAQPRAITSPMFGDGSPVFDRKGDYLFFVSRRTFSPTYSDLDTTFIYTGTQNILAVPLRADIDSPWMPKSDEEEWKVAAKKDEKKDDKAQKKEGDKADDESADDEKDQKKDAAKPDILTGTWEGTVTGPAPLPPGGMPISLALKLESDNNVTGSLTSPLYTGPISNGHFDPDTQELTFTMLVGDISVDFNMKIQGGQLTGTATADGNSFDFALSKAGAEGKDEPAKAEKKEDKTKKLVIEFDGIESRAMILPVASGRFGGLGVNDKNQLIFARMATTGGPEAGIKLFDLADEKKEEKTVAGGASNFQLTADGKKLLVLRGRSATIHDASSGAAGKNVVTTGMTVTVQPREEWNQIFTDSWRIFRDYFYDPNMHGVDWAGMRDRYGKMIADCSSRDDVSFVITEMISELNVGHAYYNGGDIPSGPSVTVGMLGCDFELAPANGDAPAAYRITRIYQGAPWDADARGPLSQPGCTIKEGDYLLAVNGVPLDTTQSPWAAFQGLANRVVTLTVNDRPTLAPDPEDKEVKKEEGAKAAEKKADKKDKDAEKPKRKTTGLRHVVVQTLGSEDDLRYRAWIESKRQYVEELTGGRVGYVYVPDTGVNGQNNLFRQFYGQTGKQAIIIDERWNGGGQIPTRFIELLNRPVTNYWARRDGKDWKWPPDSHTGPKCMLINGLAGSGGDAFPSYFKQAGLGKLIGMRTWGGLIGIQGYPPLVDGAGVSVPSFAFYRTDGNWGIEGHGVDPDLEVVDDPAKMVDGGDPQLDAAIQHMLEEIEKNGYSPPKKPAYPNRAGWGIAETDR